MSIASLYERVQVAASSVLGEHCILGYPKEQRLRAEQVRAGSSRRGEPVVVSEWCLFFNQQRIGRGLMTPTANLGLT